MTTKKRFRLPNGFGCIVQLDGHRRRPYCVKKTINGKQKIIGYATDYNEAMSILVDFNRGKTADSPTFATLFHLWKKDKYIKISKSTQNSYEASYRHCAPLHSLPIALIKLGDLQAIIRTIHDNNIGYPTQKKVKVLMLQIYAYAIKNDYTDKDYATFVELDKNDKRRIILPFITRQLNRVRAIIDQIDMSKTVLMMCYAGTRPSEFLSILLKDVKLRDRYFFIRESKTAAGRDRLVPISRKTLPCFKFFVSEAERKQSKYLISDDAGQRLTYSRYLSIWNKIMKLSSCKHAPNACRHTFATMAHSSGANELAIKRVLGHAISDITHGVYTHKSIRELKKAVDKL